MLIDCQGNWGNILTGDSAAAPRYIEARLSHFAHDVVFNPKTTEWKLSYDGRNKEPITLPVKFPLLLVHGVEGIAVGLSSRILPHNFNEVCDAAVSYLRNEEFMADSREWLTLAQLALSSGTSGNSEIPNYEHLALIGGGSDYVGDAGVAPVQPGNEDLTWENTWTSNLALHFGFWNRLNVDLELYNKLTTDMLMSVPLAYSQSNGYGYKWSNIGAMVNRGVELNLDVTVLQVKDFVWSLNANVGYNRNRLTELYNGVDEYETSNTSTKLVVGHPIGEFYVNRFAGVNPANGDALWYDKDGNIVNELRVEDKVLVGKSYFAPWQGGFGTALAWKGLSLSAQFSWVGDRWMINNDRYFDESNGRFMTYNQSRRLLERWKQPGDVTDIPRHGEYTEFDSRLLEDASFLRLKNLMLSYSLPADLLKKTVVIRGLRVYAQAQNLFTFTNFSGLDPEGTTNLYAAQYPMSRQFTFGLDLMF